MQIKMQNNGSTRSGGGNNLRARAGSIKTRDAVGDIVHGYARTAALGGIRARGLLLCAEQSRRRLLVHAHTVVLNLDLNHRFALRSNRDIDMERIFVAHRMAHRVFHQGLDHKCRHQCILDLLVDIDIHPNAILAKTGFLKRQIAQRLLDFAADRNKRARIGERRAVERGKLAQQLAGTQRLGTRKGRNGVERVEQKVREG